MSRSRTGAVLLAGVGLTTYACGTDESPDVAATFVDNGAVPRQPGS
ncbi:hypothetical protein [Actinoplanes sp. GCM10030250]